MISNKSYLQLAPLGPPAVKRESSLTGTGAMMARVQASENSLHALEG